MIRILSAFTGYPDGKKADFKEGDTPDLDEEYANLLISKGLAEPTKKAKSQRTDD